MNAEHVETLTDSPLWMEDRSAHASANALDMEQLSKILFGHAAFQYLNAACELGLLELLAEGGPLTAEQIRSALGLAERARDILLLGCTSLGLIELEGSWYRVAAQIADLVESGVWPHIKNTVAFQQYIVYEGQADFTESLRQNTNVGLRRIPGEHADLYHRLAQTPWLEDVFYRYMRSWSLLANEHLTRSVDLSDARTLLDCGGGDAVNAIALAHANPRLRVTVLEIPSSVTVAAEGISQAGLGERIRVQGLDIFTDPFPTGYDCVLFAHQMVIWTPEQNTELLRKAYDALVPGGRVVLFNSMSNDAGDGPLVAALDSVYFASLPAEGGMIYPWRQHEASLSAAGFTRLERIVCPAWTPHGIMIGTKPDA